MSQQLAVQTAGATALAAFQVPDYIKQAQAVHGGNIADRVTTNSLMFGNGTWTMSVNGEKKVIQRPNEDGDLENVQMLKVVVLGYNPVRERSYYDGAYNPAAQRAPDCWAKDGRKPNADVPEPQSKTCEICPKAAKGSNPITGGAACTQHRTLVVIPAGDFTMPALKLKISVTSDFDKKDEAAMAAGWYGFNNYTDFLRANGVINTSVLVTRIRFDPNPNITYSKVQFARGDFLNQTQSEMMLARAKTDEVQDLLNQTYGPPRTSSSGRALPADDEPVGDPVFSQTGAGAQAAQAKENARLKAEDAAKAAAVRAAAVQEAADAAAKVVAASAAVKAAADKKAAAIAAAKALLAEAEAEVSGFDDPPVAPVSVAPVAAAPVTETPPPAKRVTRKAKEEVASAPVELPEALTGIMDAWGA